MAIVEPGTSAAECQDDPKLNKVNQTNSGKNPSSKGTMREPTQQAAAAGDQEELKQALQDLEEQKGDWSKGG
jgi:hypothetical protein